jgi:OOP family OmpA-OmpF porin
MRNGGWLVVLGLAAAAGPAAAQYPGWYLGGSVGYTQFKDICKRAAVPCDDHDVGWRGFAGYQFNNWFALEGGFGNLGAAEGSGPVTGGTGTFKAEVKEAWDLGGVFLFPVATHMSLLGRVGMYRARTSVDQDVAGVTTHDAGTNSGFNYGAGAELRLGKLGVRAEWLRYENVGVAATGEDDLDVLSVGLLFRF